MAITKDAFLYLHPIGENAQIVVDQEDKREAGGLGKRKRFGSLNAMRKKELMTLFLYKLFKIFFKYYNQYKKTRNIVILLIHAQ